MKKLLLFVLSLSCFTSLAQPADTYYQAADGKKGTELKTALFQIISPHTVVSYKGVWDGIKTYDVRNDGKIWDIYSGITNFIPGDDQQSSLDVEDAEGICYNREHAMPKSWFNERDNDNYPMYTDLHHLFPTDHFINSYRSNLPYGEVNPEVKGVYKESSGGFSKRGKVKDEIGYTTYPGVVFEPNDEFKGDLARVYFYMATAYESYTNGVNQTRTPKVWKSDMLASNVYPFFTEWALKMLLRWAQQDPISEKEVKRNEGIYGIQKNRNPFVDYPGLEQYIWGSYTDVAFSYDNYAKPETTGILELHKAFAPSADDNIYDLRGQRHDGSRLKKGVYIRRGRKVVVK